MDVFNSLTGLIPFNTVSNLYVCVFISKVQESCTLPAQSLSENKKLVEGDQQREQQTTQEVDKKEQYSQV